jgi:hypothetical protein
LRIRLSFVSNTQPFEHPSEAASRKNSGRWAEDILDDVDGQAELVGDRRAPLARFA